jgi:uncharacterized protein involved in response to NO
VNTVSGLERFIRADTVLEVHPREQGCAVQQPHGMQLLSQSAGEVMALLQAASEVVTVTGEVGAFTVATSGSVDVAQLSEWVVRTTLARQTGPS